MPGSRHRDQWDDRVVISPLEIKWRLRELEREDDRIEFDLISRLLTLPIRLPYKRWKLSRLRRQMTEFARVRAAHTSDNDSVARDIALEWVKHHPADYALGVNDPRFPQLQGVFKQIMEIEKQSLR